MTRSASLWTKKKKKKKKRTPIAPACLGLRPHNCKLVSFAVCGVIHHIQTQQRSLQPPDTARLNKGSRLHPPSAFRLLPHSSDLGASSNRLRNLTGDLMGTSLGTSQLLSDCSVCCKPALSRRAAELQIPCTHASTQGKSILHRRSLDDADVVPRGFSKLKTCEADPQCFPNASSMPASEPSGLHREVFFWKMSKLLRRKEEKTRKGCSGRRTNSFHAGFTETCRRRWLMHEFEVTRSRRFCISRHVCLPPRTCRFEDDISSHTTTP
jgi:hypothetical protein